MGHDRAKTIQNKVTQNVKRSVEELLVIINSLKGELVKMKRYCVTLEQHIREVQAGKIAPTAALPVCSQWLLDDINRLYF